MNILLVDSIFKRCGQRLQHGACSHKILLSLYNQLNYMAIGGQKTVMLDVMGIIAQELVTDIEIDRKIG